MHFRLRKLAEPSNPPLYPNINIDNDVTTKSLPGFFKHNLLNQNLFLDALCTAILVNVMFAISRSFYIFIWLFARISIT